MKLISAGLIMLLCSVFGYMRSMRLGERLSLIDSFLGDIRKISMQIEFTSEPIGMVLEKIKSTSKLKTVWENMQRDITAGKSCEEAWGGLINSEFDELNCLQAEEKEKLGEFFACLGKADKKSERENARYAYETLDEISKRLKTETGNRQKLYKSLGALIGIGAAILII